MVVFDEFEIYGHMITSNKFKQGIDIEYESGRHDKQTHGIYILRNSEHDVVKIGNTRCIDNRFHTQYGHTQNTTNDRIRAYIKDNNETLSIWVYEVPTYTEDVLGIDVRYSPVDDLERKVLQMFKDRYNILPLLNVVRR